MFETTVGSLTATRLTATSPTSRSHTRRQQSPRSTSGKHELFVDAREDLASISSFDEDDMGELSDSPSSLPSVSRPVTPHDQNESHPTIVRSRGRSRSSVSPPATAGAGAAGKEEPFSLSHKAVVLLGLQPGTLAHARASLENARDEVRRTADQMSSISDSELPPLPNGTPTAVPEKKTRAQKVMSVVGVGGHARMPSVVVGYNGGKVEEEKRERRRRAADGVIYWQKEVQRLCAEEEAVRSSTMSMKKRR